MEEVKVTIGMDAGPADRELAGLQNNVRKTEQVIKTVTPSLNKAINQNTDATKEHSSALNESEQSAESARKKLRNLTDELTRLTNQYRSMSSEEKNSDYGRQIKERMSELVNKAGELRDAMEDVHREISSHASDTSGFDALAGGINVVTSSIGAATGVAAMFGVEQERLIDIQTKLQASLAISNALTVIQNNVQRESALMVGIATIQKKAAIIAENLDTAAKGRNIIVTKAATVAQGAFNLVAKANPYVLLATAILTVVGALAAFSLGSEKAEEATKAQKKSVEDAKKTMEEYRKELNTVSYSAEKNLYGNFVKLRAEWNRLSSTASKKKWIKENVSAFRELGVVIENIKDAENVFINNSSAMIEAIMLRARAAVLMRKIEANLENGITQEQNIGENALPNGKYTLGYSSSQHMAEELADLNAQIEKIMSQFNRDTKNGFDAEDKLFQQKQQDEERRAKQMLDAENVRIEAKIAAIKDNGERERAEKAHQHKLVLQQIDKQADEYRKANYNAAKKAYEAKNPGKKFSVSAGANGYKSFTLTADQEAIINAKRKKENAEYKRLIEEEQRQRQQQLYDYIREYGSIQLQKETITKEYDEKIARTSDEIKRAALAKEKERLLSELNVKELQQGLDWEAVFGNLDRMATSALKSLKEKLKAALDNKDVLPSDAKVLSEKILEIEEKISERTNVWASLLPPLRERERLIRAAKAAEDEYSRARDKQIESETKLLGLQNEALTKIKLRTGKEISSEELSSMSSEDFLKVLGLEGLDESNDEVKNAKDLFDKLSVAMTDFKESTENATETQDRRSNANALLEGSTNLKEIFKKAIEANGGGAMGTISVVANNLQSLGDLVDRFELGNTDFGQAVHGFADGVAGFQSAIGKIASGDIVGGVVGILDGIAGFGRAGISLFAGQGNVEDMEDEINYLAEVNEGLAKSIDSLSESITQNSNTNQQSIDAYKAAKKAEEEWEANQRRRIDDRASEYSNSGHGFLGLKGEHSFNYYMPGDDWGGWSRFSQILRNNGYNTNVNRGNLWNLSPEEMRLLRDYAPSEWRELLEGSGESNPSDLINEYIDRAGEMERLTSALNEKLTGYSWDGFLDSYKSLLKDLTSETDDFADHINDVISNALIESFVNEELKADIQKLYKYIAKATENGIDEEEQKTINAMNDAISQKGLTWRDNMEKAGMIKQSDGSSHSGSTGRTSSSISQETGDEISGRMTVIQVQNEALGRQVAGIVTQMQALTTAQSNSSSYLEEIRNIMITSNSFLDDIARSNKKIYSEFSSQLKSIDSKLG